MLSVTGLNHFYYVRDFTDMRCKHSRMLPIIRERLHREPDEGDVFIVMSRNCRIIPCKTLMSYTTKNVLMTRRVLVPKNGYGQGKVWKPRVFSYESVAGWIARSPRIQN